MEDPQATTYWVSLPKDYITSEPLLLATLTLPTEILSETGAMGLAMKAYVAREHRSNNIRKYTGFSEGNTDLCAR